MSALILHLQYGRSVHRAVGRVEQPLISHRRTRVCMNVFTSERSVCFGAMTSDIIKCANCNVVINELLAFIQNKVDVMDEVSLFRICSDCFSVEEIVSSKKLLFGSILNLKIKTRKIKRKNVRDVDGIISFRLLILKLYQRLSRGSSINYHLSSPSIISM